MSGSENRSSREDKHSVNSLCHDGETDYGWDTRVTSLNEVRSRVCCERWCDSPAPTPAGERIARAIGAGLFLIAGAAGLK
jgi:hypothetical protein